MFQADERVVREQYERAKQVFAAYGVDTDQAIATFKRVPISVHNWQGDDVRGFEQFAGVHSENVVTGGYPGASRNGDEMRADLDQAFKFSPCRHKLNLHSMYAEPAHKKERNAYDTEDFGRWIDWARDRRLGIDFNVSYFTHPRMKDGCSLASPDEATREYWIEAGIRSRKISADIGRMLGQPCVNNLWVPDGTKDNTADRAGYRRRLTASLDRIFETPYEKAHTRDVLEGKVFGIGTECFVAGSHDFYIAYAARHGVGVTMDTGHYHPSENPADKITAIYPFVDYLMLHLTRGVRWDSDHCLIQDDGLFQVLQEIVRAGILEENVGLGLDFFDATITRVTAWIIGLRAAGKALLTALLEPTALLLSAEAEGNLGRRLALLDEFKNLPVNAVWDQLCLEQGAGVGASWIDAMDAYERTIQSKRA
ncbi:MAG: L-rhamnose isomerase [Eubacteriales bacterium]|nr:L-rhamnose isomerase [Eubacteriales bacterium]